MSPRLRLATRLLRWISLSLLIGGTYLAYRGLPIPWLAWADWLGDAGFGPRARGRMLFGLILLMMLVCALSTGALTGGGGWAASWKRFKERLGGDDESPMTAFSVETCWLLMMLSVLHRWQYGTMS